MISLSLLQGNWKKKKHIEGLHKNIFQNKHIKGLAKHGKGDIMNTKHRNVLFKYTYLNSHYEDGGYYYFA